MGGIGKKWNVAENGFSLQKGKGMPSQKVKYK